MTDQDRLKKARAEWSRACLLLEGRQHPRGRPEMEESYLHKLCRQRMAEIAAMRKAITDYIFASGFHLFPDMVARFPELLAPHVVEKWQHLRTFAERIDDDPPVLQRLPGGGNPRPAPPAD